MKNKYIKLSSKYQLVIPSEARKTMGIKGLKGQEFSVEKVTKDKIVFKKEPSLEDLFGTYTDSFPKEPLKALRKMRDTEWDK